jgi:hypothetical protein
MTDRRVKMISSFVGRLRGPDDEPASRTDRILTETLGQVLDDFGAVVPEEGGTATIGGPGFIVWCSPGSSYVPGGTRDHETDSLVAMTHFLIDRHGDDPYARERIASYLYDRFGGETEDTP